MSNKLLQVEKGKGLSSSFQPKCKLVLQGGFTLTQSSALAIKQMEHTYMAEELRNSK